MRANGLRSSTIYAGKEYLLPGEADYSASTGTLCQATLNSDNARLASLAEERQLQSLLDAAVNSPDSFYGTFATAKLTGLSMDDVLALRDAGLLAADTLAFAKGLSAAGKGAKLAEGANLLRSSSAVRETVLANLRESALARNSSRIDTFFAKSAQIESGYAVDTWSMMSLREGDVLYSLSPTRNPTFFTDLSTLQGVQFDTVGVSEALQVRPHATLGYRPDIRLPRSTGCPGSWRYGFGKSVVWSRRRHPIPYSRFERVS